MQRPVHSHLLTNRYDLVEIIKHLFPFIFICYFWRNVCQQSKALFEGNYELLIDRFKGLDVFRRLFRGGFHLFEGLFFGLAFNIISLLMAVQKYTDVFRKSRLFSGIYKNYAHFYTNQA
jgi:hypothetical protein